MFYNHTDHINVMLFIIYLDKVQNVVRDATALNVQYEIKQKAKTFFYFTDYKCSFIS